MVPEYYVLPFCRGSSCVYGYEYGFGSAGGALLFYYTIDWNVMKLTTVQERKIEYWIIQLVF